MRNYVSLIIDIEKSRGYNIDERNEIQHFMLYSIERLNQLFEDNIEFEVTFSAGDELQGLFKDVTTAVLYFRLFEMLMKPVRLRAGIGVDEWTVKVIDGLSTQQDGPAYYKARQAIEEIYGTDLENIRIYSGGNDIFANHLINSSILYKRQQIYMQNIVLVIMELMYPFVTEDIWPERYEIVKELLDIKFHYKIGVRNFSISNKVSPRFENEYLNVHYMHEPNPIIIDGYLVEPRKAIIKKNVSSVISEILGCTRQNVDAIIRRGNINKIRELDFMALQYIRKKYGGDIWD